MTIKINLISAIIFSCVISSAALADDSCFVIGFHEPHTHTYDGPTFCDKAQFQNITVRGPLQVKNSKILGQITVSGPITASHAWLGAIEINQQFASQKISLKHQSNVHGDIIFLGSPGTVFKSNDSIITGKVINGRVQEIKTK